MKGFFGKLLRIDLSSQSFASEDIPAQTLKRYLGGKGLGSYLLLNSVPAGAGPLSPENRIILTAGPAAGTVVPGSSRYGIFTKPACTRKAMPGVRLPRPSGGPDTTPSSSKELPHPRYILRSATPAWSSTTPAAFGEWTRTQRRTRCIKRWVFPEPRRW